MITYEETVQDQKKKWIAAIEDEKKVYAENKTWSYVDGKEISEQKVL